MAKNDAGYDVPDGVAVDAIIIAPGFKVITIRRAIEPFIGMLALPGGHIDKGETSLQAIKREVKEEVGLSIDFRLIGIYDAPGRDPRGWYISHLYFGRADSVDIKSLAHNNESQSIELISPADLLDSRMAFDHELMVRDFEWHKYV